MLTFTKGDLLKSGTDVLVNSVNLYGVMGKGIALAFKKEYPENYKAYVNACKSGEIKIGKLFVTETTMFSPRYIINFPTKDHWKGSSKIEYIEAGLKDLAKWLSEHQVKSIAIPPLGSGLGKLNWTNVKALINQYLSPFASKINIIIFEPTSEFDSIQETKVTASAELTPARVMLLYLMKQYKALGNEINLLVVQKLSYFLQKFGEPLRLRFGKGWYGPYAENLIPVLKKLNGTYIHYASTSVKPETIIRLKHEKLSEVDFYFQNTLTKDQRARVERVLQLIEGFESPFGLEVLATVDFIQEQTGESSAEYILASIQNWTQRKKELIKPNHVQVAISQLKNFLVL